MRPKYNLTMETHLTNRSASSSSSAGWVTVVERLCLASSSTTANINLKRGSARADAGATEAAFSDRQLWGGTQPGGVQKQSDSHSRARS